MNRQREAIAVLDSANFDVALPPGRSLDIYVELHNAILDHRLPPGTKLSEEEVGDAFEVGRTVVRNALQALAYAELVTIARNRGAFVARPSREEANEVFEARSLVEPRIARMAAERAKPKDIRRLRAHIKKEHKALANNDLATALSLSARFHLEIADIASHQLLGRFVRTLMSRSSLIIALYWRRPDVACEKHSHDALIEALATHDGAAAEDIMNSHLVDLRSGLDLSERDLKGVSLKQALRIE
ncbi:MAG: GntR family transcriptional regulator [Pseudomonadota bacterium]